MPETREIPSSTIVNLSKSTIPNGKIDNTSLDAANITQTPEESIN